METDSRAAGDPVGSAAGGVELPGEPLGLELLGVGPDAALLGETLGVELSADTRGATG